MFDFSKFLKRYNDNLKAGSKKVRWNVRIKNYIKKHNKLLEFDNIGKGYGCSLNSAISFIESENIPTEYKRDILNLLYKEQIKTLKAQIVPAEPTKKATGDNANFNIYQVNNISELATNIIEDIAEDSSNISDIFKDYVYCFTYFYKYNSIATNIATIKKAIRDSSLDDEVKEVALKEFTLSNRVYDFLNAGGRAKRNKNMSIDSNLENIEVPFLYDLVRKANDIVDIKVTRDNRKFIFTYLSACISLAIGRRLTEIVYQSSFEKVADYKIKVTGLGKKRTAEPVVITVPTLFLNADEVIRAIEKVRSIIPKNIRVKKDIEKFGHNLSDFKAIDVYYGASKYINNDISKYDVKTVFTYLKDYLLLFVGREVLELIAHNRAIPKSYGADIVQVIDKIKSLFPEELTNPKERKKFMNDNYDVSLIKHLIKNNNAKYDNTRAMCVLVAEKLYNHHNPNEDDYKPQASYIQSILGHGETDRSTYEHYYKRQVLLKDFDLKAYLTISKSAMI